MSLAIVDVSANRKLGVKGPRAAAWLAEQGVGVPARPNSWQPFTDGGLIARLAETEFFLEGVGTSALAPRLDDLPRGVYCVPREDVCFCIRGEQLYELLLQTCSVDFRMPGPQDALFMTSMVGVPVLAIHQDLEGTPQIRLWTDPTFGRYLWRTLSEIVREFTGGLQ